MSLLEINSTSNKLLLLLIFICFLLLILLIDRMAHGSQNYGSTDQRIDVPDVGFSPTELYSLSDNITANIYTINASFRTLEKAYKNIGTSKDNQSLRDKV